MTWGKVVQEVWRSDYIIFLARNRSITTSACPWPSDYICGLFNGVSAGQVPFSGDTPT